MNRESWKCLALGLMGGLYLTTVSCQESRSRLPASARTDEAARGGTTPGTKQAGLMRTEFIFESAPFPQCHASTIAEAKNGLVAAWFGGTRERNPDVGIWLSRQVGGRWSDPVQAANGIESPAKRYPCWNPVLFQPKAGPLLLFYKVGPSPAAW